MQTVDLRRFYYGAGRRKDVAGWCSAWRQPATAETAVGSRQAVVAGGRELLIQMAITVGGSKQGNVRLIAFGFRDCRMIARDGRHQSGQSCRRHIYDPDCWRRRLVRSETDRFVRRAGSQQDGADER